MINSANVNLTAFLSRYDDFTPPSEEMGPDGTRRHLLTSALAIIKSRNTWDPGEVVDFLRSSKVSSCHEDPDLYPLFFMATQVPISLLRKLEMLSFATAEDKARFEASILAYYKDNLFKIHISGVDMKVLPLDIFEELNCLESITIENCSFEQIFLPEGFDTLKELSIYSNPNLLFLKLPKTQSCLNTLTVYGCNSLQSIFLPPSMNALTRLSVSSNESLKQLTITKKQDADHPQGLKDVYIALNPNLQTIVGLLHETNLESLDVISNGSLCSLLLPKEMPHLKRYKLLLNPNLELKKDDSTS